MRRLFLFLGLLTSLTLFAENDIKLLFERPSSSAYTYDYVIREFRRLKSRAKATPAKIICEQDVNATHKFPTEVGKLNEKQLKLLFESQIQPMYVEFEHEGQFYSWQVLDAKDILAGVTLSLEAALDKVIEQKKNAFTVCVSLLTDKYESDGFEYKRYEVFRCIKLADASEELPASSYAVYFEKERSYGRAFIDGPHIIHTQERLATGEKSSGHFKKTDEVVQVGSSACRVFLDASLLSKTRYSKEMGLVRKYFEEYDSFRENKDKIQKTLQYLSYETFKKDYDAGKKFLAYQSKNVKCDECNGIGVPPKVIAAYTELEKSIFKRKKFSKSLMIDNLKKNKIVCEHCKGKKSCKRIQFLYVTGRDEPIKEGEE